MKAYARKTEAVWDDVLIPILKDRLISLIRQWCQVWLKDPDLVIEDQHTLPDEWEQKIDLLKIKMNKLFQKIANPGGDETRLDDYAKKFVQWLHENFKESKTLWKEPQIRMTDIKGSGMEFAIRFYVDNIQLEHWSGQSFRVKNLPVDYAALGMTLFTSPLTKLLRVLGNILD